MTPIKCQVITGICLITSGNIVRKLTWQAMIEFATWDIKVKILHCCCLHHQLINVHCSTLTFHREKKETCLTNNVTISLDRHIGFAVALSQVSCCVTCSLWRQWSPNYVGARRVIGISGRYALIDCRLVTKISLVWDKFSKIVFREFWVREWSKEW